MNKQIIALAAIAVVAGCAAGGTGTSVTPAPNAKPSALAPLAKGRVTLKFTSLSHAVLAKSATRAPRFLDPGGTSGVTLTVTSVDGNAYPYTPFVSLISIPASAIIADSAVVELPLLAATNGYFSVTETDAANGQELASTYCAPGGYFCSYTGTYNPKAPSVSYGITAGSSATLTSPVTLYGEIGSIIAIEGNPLAPTSTAAYNTAAGSFPLTATANGTPEPFTFVEGDADGNYLSSGTNATVPGALPNNVTLVGAPVPGPSPTASGLNCTSFGCSITQSQYSSTSYSINVTSPGTLTQAITGTDIFGQKFSTSITFQ